MVLQRPLFMQTGTYTAAEDRFLIGGLLHPSGGVKQAPRPGVRPSGLTPGGAESALQVAASVSSSDFGVVDVAAGAAFVPNGGMGKLDGVYLVVNDGVTQVNCAPSGATGMSFAVKVYLDVVDAAFAVDTDVSSDAYARFLVLDAAEEAPPSALLLASVTVPAVTGSMVTVKDERSYTAGLGGVVPVGSAAELKGELAAAPFGSQAYVMSEGLVYTHTPRGWEAAGAQRLGGTSSRPQTNVFPGMTFYDTQRGTLQVYTSEGWVTVGQLPGAVGTSRDGLASSAVRSRRVSTGSSHFWVTVPNNTSYHHLGSNSVGEVAGKPKKPDASKLQLVVRVRSAGALVAVTLGASMWIPSPADLSTYVNENGFVAVDIKKYDGSGNLVGVPNPAGGTYSTNYFDSGITWYAKSDVLKWRTIHYQLDPGDYLFRPFLAYSGSSSPGVMQIHQIILEVTA